VNVHVAAEPVEIAHLAGAEAGLRLLTLARSAAGRGVLTADEAAGWEDDLRARDERGLFFCQALMFVGSGRVP
jgi:hypothetical protein